MKSWATFSIFVVIFLLGALFRDDWVKLSAFGLGFGFIIAFIAWKMDRQLHRFGSDARWASLKFWAVGSVLVAAVAAGSAYWFSKEDALVSGGGAFLGVGLAALCTELLARRRQLA